MKPPQAFLDFAVKTCGPQVVAVLDMWEELRWNTANRCGSLAGYRAHYERGEKPCEPCRSVNSEYQVRRMYGRPDLRHAKNERDRERYARDPEYRERVKIAGRARRERLAAANGRVLGTHRPAEHGTRSMYVKGCRCESCRSAQREHDRARRRKAAAS